MDQTLLSVANLTVERGGRRVIEDLSFDLLAGEVLLVAGRNGAGKSTLLRTLSRLLDCVAGSIEFPTAAADGNGIEQVHFLGYDDALKPSLTVAENLDFWSAMLRDDADQGLTPAAALDALGIERLLHLRAAYLSAGQKRRVALARLLVSPRPIWLLDEPLIALDATAQALLLALIGEQARRGGAVLLASHQILTLPHRTIDLDGVHEAAEAW